MCPAAPEQPHFGRRQHEACARSTEQAPGRQPHRRRSEPGLRDRDQRAGNEQEDHEREVDGQQVAEQQIAGIAGGRRGGLDIVPTSRQVNKLAPASCPAPGRRSGATVSKVSGLPGVVLRRGLVAGKDVIQPLERILAEPEREGMLRVIQLAERPRPDDWRGHPVLV